MINELFPLWVAILANLIAQGCKPFFNYLKSGEWDWKMVFESGGFPSSHTATVSALALATGFVDNFSSTAFSVSVIMCLVVCYDAANVRYYSGQNIKVTQQLIKDIENLTRIQLNDPIYQTKLKAVLGHKWIEVAGGLLWGLTTCSVVYLFLI